MAHFFIDTTVETQQSDTNKVSGSPAIAVIAASCRLPGGIRTLSAFHEALVSGADNLQKLPSDLFARDYEHRSALRGGLIDDVFDFDPLLFGISPREAQTLDPQQRLALKLTWELFENAALARPAYVGSDTGVFLGVCDNNYFPRIKGHVSKRDSLYLPTGNALNAIAGRVNHCFGLTGPALAIDTACSSSLAAIHLAIQALRSGNCTMAVAGGLNVMLDAERNQTLIDIGMLSPDGHCRVFDAKANGYVRSEAAGLVLLKPLEAAIKDGDCIHGVILGTACNHNGSGAGLTVPSGAAQQKVMRAALVDANLGAECVEWVEAHGTGTPLGDPIEFEAITRVFSGNARVGKSAVKVTSLKSQFGHAESAAGIISVLKALAVLNVGQLPCQYGLSELNPAIAAMDSDLYCPRELTALRDENPVAMVNGFGFSGTNSSLVLSGPPQIARGDDASRHALGLYCLSAQSQTALERMAGDLATYLEERPECRLNAIEYLLNAGRTSLKYRKSIVAKSAEELITSLKALVAGDPIRQEMLVFAFPGQGAQYPTMGLSLYRALPAFAREFDLVTALLAERLQLDSANAFQRVLWDETSDTLAANTLYTQCGLFAVGYALGRMLIQLGARPAALVGHSVGELVACALAEVWSLSDACDIVVKRGCLMQEQTAPGRMLSVRASAEELSDLLADFSPHVVVAARNAPRQVVLSGKADMINEVEAILARRKIASVLLPVGSAFHSPLMHAAAARFREYLMGKPSSRASIPIVSTYTGSYESGAFCQPEYWQKQMLGTVDLLGASETLESHGNLCVVEIGAGKVCSGNIAQSLSKQRGHRFIHWETRSGSSPDQIALALAGFFEAGQNLNWSAHYKRNLAPANIPRLPNYSFDSSECLPVGGREYDAAHKRSEIVYLRLPEASLYIAQHEFSLRTHEYLRDHVVFGSLLAPGAMHCIYALEAANQHFGRSAFSAISGVHFTEAAICREHDQKQLQAIFSKSGGRTEFKTVSFAEADEDGGGVITHASGYVDQSTAPDASDHLLRATSHIVSSPRLLLTGEEFYRRFREIADLDLGPSFRWIQSVHVDGERAVARFKRNADSGRSPFAIDPGLLDSCFQIIGSLPLISLTKKKTFVPFSVGRVIVSNDLTANEFTCHVAIASDGYGDSGMITGSAVLVDDRGRIAMQIDDLTVKEIAQRRLLRKDQSKELAAKVYGYRELPTGVQGRLSESAGLSRGVLEAKDLVMASECQIVLETVASEYAKALLSNWPATMSVTQTTLWARLVKFGNGEQDAKYNEQVARIFRAHGFEQCDAVFRELKATWPQLMAEFDLLHTCLPSLADVLTGRKSGVSVLFPDGEADVVVALYRDSKLAQSINQQFARSVVAAVRERDSEVPLRILEIGGGTGGTTAYLLDALAGFNVEYVFTDISPRFVQDARERFRMFENVSFTVLDIESYSPGHDLPAANFDIVVAANVLHAVHDLPAALSRLNTLAKPGTDLFILEGRGQQAWLDLTFGLTEGWWHFEDFRKASGYPLLEPDQWRQVLDDQGFLLHPLPEEEKALPQVVYGARKCRAASRNATCYMVLGADGPVQQTLIRALCEGGAKEAIGINLGDLNEHMLKQALASISEKMGAVEQTVIVYLDQSAAVRLEHADDYLQIREHCMDILRVVSLVKQASDLKPCVFNYLRHMPDLDRPDISFEATALKTLSTEIESEWIRYIQAADIQHLAWECLSENPHPCVSYAQGIRFERHLENSPALSSLEQPDLSVAGLTHIITGANSALSESIVAWLMAQGARRVELLLRNKPTTHTERWVSEAAAQGCEVVLHVCDVRDRSQVSACIERILCNGRRVDSLFHLAGVLDNKLIEHQSLASMDSVIGTKLQGALNVLDSLAGGMPRRVVFYSSAAAVIGSPGQINHSLANALLDQLAAKLVARGTQALSIAWGPWGEIGAAARDRNFGAVRSWGIGLFSPTVGREMTDYLLANGSGHVIPLDIDWQRFIETVGNLFVGRESRALSLQHRAEDGIAAFDFLFPTHAELERVAASERPAILMNVMRKLLGAALSINPQSISEGDRIRAMGLDSLVAIEIKSRLKAAYAVEVPAKLFMENLTLEELVSQICSAIFAASMQSSSGVLEGEL